MLFAISATLAAQALLGWPLVRLADRAAAPDLRGIGAALGCGLLLFYAAGLLAPAALMAGASGVGPAAGGLAAALFLWLRRRAPGDAVGTGLAALLLAAMAFYVLAQPLAAWDARSIWFFQAKAVYHARTALSEPLWRDPFPPWGHADYPKLLAVTAAVWTSAFDGWNEYLPKASLLFLQAPAVCLALGCSRSLPLRLFVLVALVLKNGEMLASGEMDGILASYVGIAALYGGRWLSTREPQDLLAALVAAGLAAGLKNEGIVAAAVAIGAVGACALATRRAFPLPWRVIFIGKIMILPSLLWIFWRVSHGVVSELGGGDAWAHLADRLADPAARASVFSAILRPKQVRANGWLLLVAGGIAFYGKKRGVPVAWREVVPALLAAGVYGVILAAVYLATPYDLAWHLRTSAGRTTMPVFALILAGIAGLARSGVKS